MTTIKKRIIILLVSILVIITLILIQPIIKILYFHYVSKWKPAIEDFKSYEDSFLVVANYAIQHFDSGLGDDNKILSITKDPDTGETTLYDYKQKYLSLDDDTRRCLNDAIEAFSDPDYPLYDIVEIDNKIYFHTEKRHYALVYSPNGTRPRSLLGDKHHSISVKRIKWKWYHVVLN